MTNSVTWPVPIGAGTIALGLALVAIVLAVLGKRSGLGLAAVDVAALVGLNAFVTMQQVPTFPLSMLPTTFWAAVLLVIGMGCEGFADRLGIRVFRIDRQVLVFAGVGMLLALFSPFGMSSIILGAFAGAVLGSVLSGARIQAALHDGLGALLAIFGPDGIRLMCTLSLASLVVSNSMGIR